MIKRIKSNKIMAVLLIAVCLIIMTNPAFYSKSCLNAISVWATKVLPVLFPFFILTRLIVSLSEIKPSFIDKPFNKLYNAPTGSFYIYFLSILSGYPMGAKLICQMYENGRITNLEAKKMMSFCSVSGPMFILGTVGISIFCSYKAGIIILISNIIASLINGLIYRGKKTEIKEKNIYLSKNNPNLLSDSVYDSLISVLMVGGFIVLSFLIVDFLTNIGFIQNLSNAICCVFNCNSLQDIVQATLSGCIEMTRGIIDINSLNISLKLKTVIASGLIGFGGLSIIMQSISFLSKLKIPIKSMFLQKLTQGILCVIITSLLVAFI